MPNAGIGKEAQGRNARLELLPRRAGCRPRARRPALRQQADVDLCQMNGLTVDQDVHGIAGSGSDRLFEVPLSPLMTL
jgi:hypothetical protein